MTFRELSHEANAALAENRGKTFLAIFAILLIQGIAGYFSQEYKNAGGGLLNVLLIPLNFGGTLLFLRLVRREPFGVGTIFEPFRKYLHYLWGGVRVLIFIFLWSLLLIVPGIIAAFRYALTYFIMLDNPELSAKESMKRSGELMHGNKLKLFGYGMLLGLAGFGAMLLFFLFLLICPFPAVAFLLFFAVLALWYIPWCGAFMAEFYCHVIGETGAADVSAPAEDAQI